MSEPREFLAPTLEGKRFTAHTIPLDVLKDLAVLQDLVIEVSKDEYLKANPDRQRCPNGFTKKTSLCLAQIREGSAIPVICFAAASLGFQPPEEESYLISARDSIIRAISAASSEESKATDHLSSKALAYFDKIGQSLKEDEAFLFDHPDENRQQSKVRLDRKSRKNLVMASSGQKEMLCDTTKRGLIPMADQKNKEFKLQTIDDKLIKGPLDDVNMETVLKAFNGFSTGQKVLIHGVGRFNRHDQITSFESIQQVMILDDLDVPSRLEELEKLEDGWLEGHGKAPPKEGLKWFSELFDEKYSDFHSLPYVYPTEEGGIRLEWEFNSWELSLDVDLSNKTASWHGLNSEDDSEDSKEGLPLEDNDTWEWLSAQLSKYSGAVA